MPDFVLFGPPHLMVMALTVAVPLGLIVLCRRAGSKTLTRWIARSLAVVLVANEIIYYVYGVIHWGWWHLLENNLPLHICGVALFLVAVVLWTGRGQRMYETAFFWGLAGTLQGIITPNLTEGFPEYRFFQFFVTHCGIVVSALFATLAMGMRPKRGAVLRALLITNAYAVVVGGIDWLIGGDANYMFLCGPPEGASFFFFLPWPWYILFLEPVGAGLYLILYSPFWLANRIRRRRRPAAGPIDWSSV